MAGFLITKIGHALSRAGSGLTKGATEAATEGAEQVVRRGGFKWRALKGAALVGGGVYLGKKMSKPAVDPNTMMMGTPPGQLPGAPMTNQTMTPDQFSAVAAAGAGPDLGQAAQQQGTQMLGEQPEMNANTGVPTSNVASVVGSQLYQGGIRG